MNAADPQRQNCYAWERSFRPVEETPAAISVRKPFAPEFLQFFATAWEYGYGLHGKSRVRELPQFVCAERLPKLRYCNRLRRVRAMADMRFDRKGVFGPTITMGPLYTRPILLHEIAHVLTNGDWHGPDFCRVALDLYVKFLGVEESHALWFARQHGVRVAAALVGA